MASINEGRFAAEIDGEYVVYINGMRLNKLRALPRYLRAGIAAGRMFRRLARDPDSGFLGYLPAYMGPRSGAAIQYWRSLEDIKRFARDPDGPHVPAWRWYNEAGGTDGGLGFWAELYVVKDGSFETFYRNVPPVGLGEHGRLVPMDDHDRGLGLAPTGTTPWARTNRRSPHGSRRPSSRRSGSRGRGVSRGSSAYANNCRASSTASASLSISSRVL